MERARMAMSDRLFPSRRNVDRFQWKGDFNEFLAGYNVIHVLVKFGTVPEKC